MMARPYLPGSHLKLKPCKPTGHAQEPWYLAMNIHKQYGVYFESQRSNFISNTIHFLSFSRFEQGILDHETNNIAMCHRTSLDTKHLLNVHRTHF